MEKIVDEDKLTRRNVDESNSDVFTPISSGKRK